MKQMDTLNEHATEQNLIQMKQKNYNVFELLKKKEQQVIVQNYQQDDEEDTGPLEVH